MPFYRAQVWAAADSLFARDRIVNVLYFNDSGLGSDPDGLSSDLANVFLDGWYTSGTREVGCRFYDMADDEPRSPVGETILNAGLSPSGSLPREVAICLSFYGEHNRPRERGRIYLCATLGGILSGGRPDGTARAKVMALAQDLADLGGTDVDWNIWSPTSNERHAVQVAWCDDEWDTIRSRGLRSTTRDTLVVSE